MKFSRYLYLSGILAASMVLGSCSETLMQAPEQPGTQLPAEDDDEDMVDLTISFLLKDVEDIGTRADGNRTDSYFGEKINNIDLLVYALLDDKEKVLLQYGKGVDKSFKKLDASGNVLKDEEGRDIINITDYPAFKNYDEQVDNNQTLMPVSWTKTTETNEEIYEMDEKVVLRVMRGKEYTLCCWAQSSQTTAYDFNYLTAVKVNYEGALNNDENRDAFCAASKFSIGQMSSNIQVTLTRPFAQINVGVPKDDSTNEANLAIYTTSQMELEEVSTIFNVVANKTWSKKDLNDFHSGKFGKYYDKALFGKNPDGSNITDPQLTADVTFSYAELPKWPMEVYNFNGWDGKPFDAPTSYTSLSMCYVLVPEAVNNYDENGVSKDITIKLKAFRMTADDGSSAGSAVDITYPQTGTLDMQVKRNWRTNLLFKNWDHLKGIQ